MKRLSHNAVVRLKNWKYGFSSDSQERLSNSCDLWFNISLQQNGRRFWSVMLMMLSNFRCIVVGTISEESPSTGCFVWMIENFSLLPYMMGKLLLSPLFIFGDETWRLSVEFPCNQTAVFINISNITRRKRNYCVSYMISISTGRGREYISLKGKDDFQSQIGDYGRTLFFERSRISEINYDNYNNKGGNYLRICCTLEGENDGLAEVMPRTIYPESKDGYTQTEQEESLVSEEKEGNDEHTITSNLKDMNRLTMDLKDLLLNEEEWDVIVKVKDREFKAHKAILIARSSVFASMFKHNMAEKNSGMVDVTDCDPEVFQDFLHHLYTGNVENLTTQNVFGLYCAADKYSIQDLKNDCVNFMTTALSVDTICDVISLSLRHNEDMLLKKATTFFLKNFKKIVVTLKWQTFLKENPTAANELLVKLSNIL